MLTRKFGASHLLTSKALTVAIVSSVVMINSVAWGIPLLIGARSKPPAPDRPLAYDRSDMAARTGRRLALETLRQRPLPKNTGARVPPLVPLPQPAPTARDERREPRKKAVVARANVTAPPPLLASKPPATLFPRPEPAPAILNERLRFMAPLDTDATPTERTRVDSRKPARDVVLVSPYTPGVRLVPNGGGHEFRHRNLRAENSASTIDAAKSIARRAAERFKQVRERIAVRSTQNNASRGAVLPVAARPPRIVDDGIGRTVAKSAYSYVRPRLVRRPLIAGTGELPGTETTIIPGLPTAAPASKPVEKPAARPVPQKIRVARVESSRDDDAIARAEARRAAGARIRHLRSLRAEVRAARIRRSRPTRQASRPARVRQRRYAHRARKIDGFRRSFHRQLVAANFFGANSSH